MRIKKGLIFLLIAVFITTFALPGCYDLGEATENDADYRETYSTVSLIDRSSSVRSFSMEDFYNDEAVNDFKSPMSESIRDEYAYIYIKSEKSVALGEIAIYFDSTVAADVYVKVFILNEDEIPSKIYTGEGGTYSVEECDEPDVNLALAEVSFHVVGKPDKWKELYVKSWGVKDEPREKRRNISEGQYIVFRIDNNCYDPAKIKLDKAEKAKQALIDDFNAKAAALRDVLNDASATNEQKNAAQRLYDNAAAAKNAGELAYNEALLQYEKEKSPATTKVPFRITAVLINAE